MSINIGSTGKVFVSFESAEYNEEQVENLAIKAIEDFISAFQGVEMPSFETSITSEIVSDGPNRGVEFIDVELVNLTWEKTTFLFDMGGDAIGIVDTGGGYVATLSNKTWASAQLKHLDIEEYHEHFHLI